jgi:hypothetical protein
VLVELNVGELRNPVDGEEHDEFSVRMGEFDAIDVDVANVVSFGLFPLFRGLARREAGNAVALKATRRGASARVWNGVLHTAEDVIPWQGCPASELGSKPIKKVANQDASRFSSPNPEGRE